MLQLNTISKKKLFWIFQLSGWTLFWLVDFINFIPRSPDNLSLWLFCITHVEGFIITSFIFRYILQKIYQRVNSIVYLTFFIALFSILFSFLWYYSDVFPTYYIIRSNYPATQVQLWYDHYLNLESNVIFFYLLNRTFILIGWSSLYFVINSWVDLQNEKEKSAKATELACHAQLQMLRYQLNPHFLFNSLNSIRALTTENSLSARKMVTELSEFLRHSLRYSAQTMIPLKEELGIIQHYLFIEKKRFEDKLKVNYKIAPEAEDFPVLSFILQPIVENAIKYGMLTSKVPLTVNISARADKNRLTVQIENSGKWVENYEEQNTEDESWIGSGKGLENINQRLQNIYNNNYQLTHENNDDFVITTLILNEKKYG